MYVTNFADKIIWQDFDCDCRYGSFKIWDNWTWVSGYAGHEFSVNFKTYKAENMFKNMNQSILDAYGRSRMNETIKSRWNGDFCQGDGGKKTDENDPFLSWREPDELGKIYDVCSVNWRSNTVYLRALWLKMNEGKKWVRRLYGDATIGNHDAAIKYHRTGSTKTLSERSLSVPNGF